MEAVSKPWELEFRAVLAVSLNPFTLAGQEATTLRNTLQDTLSRMTRLEPLVPPLRTACERFMHLYRPAVEAGQLTKSFFDDIRDEVARELRLMEDEQREVKALEAAIARRYQEPAPKDHLGTIKGLGDVTTPTILAAVGTPHSGGPIRSNSTTRTP